MAFQGSRERANNCIVPFSAWKISVHLQEDDKSQKIKDSEGDNYIFYGSTLQQKNV